MNCINQMLKQFVFQCFLFVFFICLLNACIFDSILFSLHVCIVYTHTVAMQVFSKLFLANLLIPCRLYASQ